MLEKHSDYAQEKEWLIYTNKCIADNIDEITMRLSKGFKTFDDLVADNLSLFYNRKLNALHNSQDKPYFARIDFKEQIKPETRKYYIGKTSVLIDDSEIVVIDWRAPVSSLYYDGSIGDMSYECPEGIISGDLSLKRQIDIERGEILNINDIDVSANDEFLKPYLGVSADNRLKNIIATIQSEQNKVIRAGMYKSLLVQGVAGSGKTTIAIHRISYLIYTYEKKFKPEEFMIIGPNKFFMNYIANSLPDLGAEDVGQFTFEEFALGYIGEKLTIIDKNLTLSEILDDSEKAKEFKYIALLKSSMGYKKLIDDYLKQESQKIIPEEDFKLSNSVLLEHSEIKRMFCEKYSDKSYVERLNDIRKEMLGALNQKGPKVLMRLEYISKQALDRLSVSELSEEEKQKRRIQIIDKKAMMEKEVELEGKNIIKEYFKKIKLPKALSLYKGFVENILALSYNYLDYENKSLILLKDRTAKYLKKSQIEHEDIAPLMHIKHTIGGNESKQKYRHVIIDEAQDLSVFQFAILKNVLVGSSFTIFGDIAQSIYSYKGTQNWEEVKREAFNNEIQIEYLRKSYRTTVEIMECANKVIRNLNDGNVTLAEPVIRHGEQVKILSRGNISVFAGMLDKRITEFKNKGFKSIAIICKNLKECQELYKEIDKYRDDVNIITCKDVEYKGEISIIPSFLSKGLEFDAVVISNASNINYANTEIDIKLLYVSMTRALHVLEIYYDGILTELL